MNKATEEDYKKIVGKCFINDDHTVIVKVVGIRDDYDSPYYECDHHVDNFLYEKYKKHNTGIWHHQEYIWLQEIAKDRYRPRKEYLRWCLTNQTDMNIHSKDMFRLDVDGNLYVGELCDGDYETYRPISEAVFDDIREEVIKNDGEYEAKFFYDSYDELY